MIFNETIWSFLVLRCLSVLRCVLCMNSRERREFVTQDRVREALGIPKMDYGDSARHNALIYGILYHLKQDGYAEHVVSYGWRITEKGISALGG